MSVLTLKFSSEVDHLFNRVVPCGKLNFVFALSPFKEDLTLKQLHVILTAVSLKRNIIKVEVTTTKTS